MMAAVKLLSTPNRMSENSNQNNYQATKKTPRNTLHTPQIIREGSTLEND